ncbi:MAG: dihydrofolate reductase [Planctomycetota bacterium]
MSDGFALIVAMDRGRGIGRDGSMPWHLPGDLRLFADLTKGEHRLDPARLRNRVIMGRRTWESLPPSFRPLPDRINLVLSRRSGLALEGATVVGSLDEALAAPGGEAFVIGGGEIYALALAHPGCRRLHLTEVDARYPCDAFFPEVEDRFRLDERGPWQQDSLDGPAYRFTTWSRAEAEATA